MNHRDIIRRSLLTEKVTRLQEAHNQYVFEVDLRANKIEIKRAVESRFGVKVKGVQTMTVPGKVRRLGRFTGRRPDWKKAVVTLMPGEKIDFLEAGPAPK